VIIFTKYASKNTPVRVIWAYLVIKKANGRNPPIIVVTLLMGFVIIYRLSKNRKIVRFSDIARVGYQ